MDISSIINHSLARTNTRQHNGTTVPIISREDILGLLQREDGKGIRCGNPGCENKARAPRQGHKSCIGFFCKTCCVETVRQVLERSDPVNWCAVQSHQLGSGAYKATGQMQQPKVMINAAANGFQQQLGHVAMQLTTAATGGDIVNNQDPVDRLREPINLDEPLIGPPTHHAMPLARMWQTPTGRWVQNLRTAAANDIGASNHKKSAAETKVLQRSSIIVVLWYKVSFDSTPYMRGTSSLTMRDRME